jgi:hypothetical protein
MESRQLDGEWWLPESPDHVVPGTLSVSDQGEIELRLFDSLRSELHGLEPTVNEDGSTQYTITSESIAARGKYLRILGRSGSSGYTLDDCFTVHRTGLFGGTGTERIHVHRMFKDVHFSLDEPIQFTDIVVQMDGLAFWTALSGMKEAVQFKKRKNSDAVRILGHTLEIKNVTAKNFAGPDGAKFKLGHTYSIRGNEITDRTFAQDFYIAASHPDLVDLDELLAEASALQDLISIATGRPAAFTSVSLRHRDVVRKMGRRKRLIPIEMVAPWVVKPSARSKELKSHELWFTLTDFGGVSTISRWLDVALDNRSTLSRVMSTRYSPSMYATDHLFNCAAALEAYDRQKNPKGAYLARVKRCIDFAGDPFASLVDDTNKWATVMKNARNDVAHHNVNIVGASTEQIVMSRSAFWLFVLCLLRDAQVPDAVFGRLTEHQDWHWLRGQVAGVLADA